MNRDSEITPFDRSESPSTKSSKSSPSSSSPSAKIRRVSTALKWAGTSGFWVQLFLGVISTVMLLLAIVNRTERSNQGTGFSLFCAFCGLICLIVGIYLSFRYTKLAGKFEQTANLRPKKSDTISSIEIGLMVSLVGMLLTLIGAEAITGIVLSKILAFGQGELIARNDKEFVTPLDLFIVQANINIIAAHFAGIVSSLWLLHRITK
jgi:hypothetical protein